MSVPIVGSFVLLLLSNLFVPAASHLRIPSEGAAASDFSMFPVFGSALTGFVGLSIINTSAITNDVTVTWTDSAGLNSRTGFLSLPSSAQRVVLVKEILGIQENLSEGWIRIDSSGPGLLSYMTTGGDAYADATAPVSLASPAIVLPHIAVLTGFMELGHSDTLVSLVNPGSAVANAQAALVSVDGLTNGLTIGMLNIAIPACGSRTVRISEAFDSVLPPNQLGGRIFRGYLKVTADMPLAAWLQIETPLSRRLLSGSSIDSVVPERQLLVSHFASGSPALYSSQLNVINIADTAVTLDIVAQDDRGLAIGKPARRTLEPGQAVREDVLDLFGIVSMAVFPPPLITGYIRIRESGGGTLQLLGDIDITAGTDAAAMLYPIGAPSSSTAVLPFVINDSDFYTGYALANSNELLTVQTDITVELFGPDGVPVTTPRHVSLSPAARFVSLIPEKVRSGYLKISTNGPIAVLGSIGAWNNSLVTPLPVLR